MKFVRKCSHCQRAVPRCISASRWLTTGSTEGAGSSTTGSAGGGSTSVTTGHGQGRPVEGSVEFTMANVTLDTGHVPEGWTGPETPVCG